MGVVSVELFLVHKSNYSRLFGQQDAFFYPLALNTPLLHARYVGKPLSVKLSAFSQPLSGLFLGVIDQTLYSYFYKHLGAEALAVSTLSFGENEEEWLALNSRSPHPFEGVKHISNPKEPPFFVVLSDLGDCLLFSAYSEQEQTGLPQINFNLVITNESIEKLKSHLKKQLPHSRQLAWHKAAQKPSRQEKRQQTRLRKFLGK